VSPLVITVILLAVAGLTLFIFTDTPVAPYLTEPGDPALRRNPVTDEMIQAAYDRSEVFTATRPLPGDQEEATRARIALYRQRAEAIADPAWRAAHLYWVEFSEDEIRRAVRQREESEAVSRLRSQDPLRT